MSGFKFENSVWKAQLPERQHEHDEQKNGDTRGHARGIAVQLARLRRTDQRAEPARDRRTSAPARPRSLSIRWNVWSDEQRHPDHEVVNSSTYHLCCAPAGSPEHRQRIRPAVAAVVRPA